MKKIDFENKFSHNTIRIFSKKNLKKNLQTKLKKKHIINSKTHNQKKNSKLTYFNGYSSTPDPLRILRARTAKNQLHTQNTDHNHISEPTLPHKHIPSPYPEHHRAQTATGTANDRSGSRRTSVWHRGSTRTDAAYVPAQTKAESLRGRLT